MLNPVGSEEGAFRFLLWVLAACVVVAVLVLGGRAIF